MELVHAVSHKTAPVAVDAARWTGERAERFEPHWHHEHQLLWCPRGLVSIEVDGHSYLMPPTLAIWIPSGVDHAVETCGPSEMVSLYLDPDECPVDGRHTSLVHVGDFLRASIERLENPLLPPAERERTANAMFDVIQPIPALRWEVVMPTDPRIARIAEQLLRRPHDGRTLLDWGNEVGACARTLNRLFLSETGMTFSDWRARSRMLHAVSLMAIGQTAAQAGRAVGYRNASAFAQAFRRVMGNSPATFARSA